MDLRKNMVDLVIAILTIVGIIIFVNQNQTIGLSLIVLALLISLFRRVIYNIL